MPSWMTGENYGTLSMLDQFAHKGHVFSYIMNIFFIQPFHQWIKIEQHIIYFLLTSFICGNVKNRKNSKLTNISFLYCVYNIHSQNNENRDREDTARSVVGNLWHETYLVGPTIMKNYPIFSVVFTYTNLFVYINNIFTQFTWVS